jgi:hypothetical protein
MNGFFFHEEDKRIFNKLQYIKELMLLFTVYSSKYKDC